MSHKVNTATYFTEKRERNSMTMKKTFEVFFQGTPCLAGHLHVLMTEKDSYMKALNFLCESGTFAVVSSGVRARIIAALHILSEHQALSMLLQHCEPSDIAKALTLLDRPRKARQLNRKIMRIESERPHVIRGDACVDSEGQELKRNNRKRTRGKVDVYRGRHKGIVSELECEAARCDNKGCLEAHESSAVKELIESSSVSGALARKIRNWAKTGLTSDSLEFMLLAMPPTIWKTIADIVHFSPNNFALPYFLVDVHRQDGTDHEGQSDCSMESNFVHSLKELVKKSDDADVELKFRALAEEYPQVFLGYQFIRLQESLATRPLIMELIARHAPLETVIWYFEEFYKVSRNCEAILQERLTSGKDDVRNTMAKSKATSYGKLLERILTFRRMRLSLATDILPVAAHRLEELTSYWKGFLRKGNKVAVFGDASSSMQLAIEAATIFASMVSACFDGELSFFASGLVDSPHRKPSSVDETLEVCDKIRANGCTSLAAALWPYYDKKEHIDMFVLVTDEEENTAHKGHMFSSLLAAYKKEVNPEIALVVVCVGKGYPPFRASLVSNKIDYKVVYIDSYRPDLAKFDALLGQLVLVSSGRELHNDTAKNSSPELDDFVVV